MYQQSRNEKNIKFLTVLAVLVLFVLILILVTVLVQNAQLENRKKQLSAQIEYYQTLIVDNEDMLALRETYEYLEQQARELGMIGEFETLFQTGK